MINPMDLLEAMGQGTTPAMQEVAATFHPAMEGMETREDIQNKVKRLEPFVATWAYAKGIITGAEFRAHLNLPPIKQAPLQPPEATGSRCAYCRTFITHPTRCESCGASR